MIPLGIGVITSAELCTELQFSPSTLAGFLARDQRFKEAKLCRGKWLTAKLRASGLLPSVEEAAAAARLASVEAKS